MKKALDYIKAQKECIYTVKTYDPPFVPHYTCFFFRDGRGIHGGIPKFKKLCSKDDWKQCPFNVVKEMGF